MLRTDVAVSTMMLGLVGCFVATVGCSSSSSNEATTGVQETNPTCLNGARDGDETGVDCGGSCVTACNGSAATGPDGGPIGTGPGASNGTRDGDETDVDCGGTSGIKCGEGKACATDNDCTVACSYAKKCIGAPSCAPHLGGDTCGVGEVGEAGAMHESCCRTLEVKGFSDPAHAGKKVYLDKYEITAGRVRAWVEAMAKQGGGNPNIKAWIAANRPQIWDDAWNEFLPTDMEGGSKVINRRLLGDPRPEDDGQTGNPGPGVILPPATDQPRSMGINHQFNSTIYVDLHGNNCGAFAGSWGFSTYWYPPDILNRDGQLPRVDGLSSSGATIPAKDLLDVKSMNCITNAMLAAFCAWDGGQLATDEVLDFVTDTPASRQNVSGCGEQIDNHGRLLNNDFTGTIQTGGRCAPLAFINATFDAGDNLPVAGSPLNIHNYHYPDLGGADHDKAWQISAPGRASQATGMGGQQLDVIRLNPGDEPWVDLHGNVNEAALDMSGAEFTGNFSMKLRGIGYGSSRSDLNVKPIQGESILRVQRPEAKAAYAGGRCMRFK